MMCILSEKVEYLRMVYDLVAMVLCPFTNIGVRDLHYVNQNS